MAEFFKKFSHDSPNELFLLAIFITNFLKWGRKVVLVRGRTNMSCCISKNSQPIWPFIIERRRSIFNLSRFLVSVCTLPSINDDDDVISSIYGSWQIGDGRSSATAAFFFLLFDWRLSTWLVSERERELRGGRLNVNTLTTSRFCFCC